MLPELSVGLPLPKQRLRVVGLQSQGAIGLLDHCAPSPRPDGHGGDVQVQRHLQPQGVPLHRVFGRVLLQVHQRQLVLPHRRLDRLVLQVLDALFQMGIALLLHLEGELVPLLRIQRPFWLGVLHVVEGDIVHHHCVRRHPKIWIAVGAKRVMRRQLQVRTFSFGHLLQRHLKSVRQLTHPIHKLHLLLLLKHLLRIKQRQLPRHGDLSSKIRTLPAPTLIGHHQDGLVLVLGYVLVLSPAHQLYFELETAVGRNRAVSFFPVPVLGRHEGTALLPLPHGGHQHVQALDHLPFPDFEFKRFTPVPSVVRFRP
mmetsp:Transcript_12907/g.20187  ORF Transcript_12907/g.20187 Transcript_12907/m.20187 type:complete len:312 (+) Transcript_12907:885-1820(+)